MRGGLLLLGVAVAACAAAGLLLLGAVSAGLSTGGPALLTAAATLILAAISASFAWQAVKRTQDMAAELERLARSIDATVAGLNARGDRDRAAVAELQEMVSRHLGAGLPAAHDSPSDPETQPLEPASSSPTVPEPADASVQPADAAPAPRPADTPPDLAPVSPEREEPATASLETASASQMPRSVTPESAAAPEEFPAPPEPKRETPIPEQLDPEAETALRRLLVAGRAELSLQPIVSISKGAANGFEVHVHLVPAKGAPLDLRRWSRPVRGLDAAAFERVMVISTLDAVRRRPGRSGPALPLHVAISAALLGSPSDLGAAVDMFRRNPALARSVILSLPTADIGPQQLTALQRFAAADVGLAVEGWDRPAAQLAELRKVNLRLLKLHADRLLDPTGPAAGEPPAVLIGAAELAGVDIVATDVQNDEDAVEILDLGIDLMTGPRFSGPRLMEPGRDTPAKPALPRLAGS